MINLDFLKISFEINAKSAFIKHLPIFIWYTNVNISPKKTNTTRNDELAFNNDLI